MVLLLKTVSVLVLCVCLSEAQRFRGGRGGRRQTRRRGRQDELGGGYDAPVDDVPVYAGSEEVPVYESADAGSDPLAALANNIPGVPGEDYPIYAEVPESAFSCDGQVDGGRTNKKYGNGNARDIFVLRI